MSDLTSGQKKILEDKITDYLAFRKDVDNFLQARFSDLCSENCYRSRLSACCSKDGIITFFADVVINVFMSTGDELARLIHVLQSEHKGNKCVYLGESGCLWRVKPLVCEMFLCTKAENAVFTSDTSVRKEWESLKQREKSFRWPDQPILFDDIEKIFIAAGYSSPLMYLHKSPGLLRVKEQANVGL